MGTTLCDLYVIDKTTGRIHRIGDEQHDSIEVKNGDVHYYNLQNGEGGVATDFTAYGYVILRSESGMLEDEFGIIDKRFKDEIKEYLEEARKNDGERI